MSRRRDHLDQRSLWESAGCIVVEAAVPAGLTAPLRWRCCKCQHENNPLRTACAACKHDRCAEAKRLT